MCRLENIFRVRMPFRVTAITIARNEELYIEAHIRHLLGQGIDLILIDNGSTDRTRAIAASFLGRGVLKIIDLPYRGSYMLSELLDKAEETARKTRSDWFIFLNPDEFPLPGKPYPTLRKAFLEVDRKGYNAVNFNEFVFLPENQSSSYEGRDFVDEMRAYYYFNPRPHNRIIAWKYHHEAEFTKSAGHRVSFPGQRIFPENFAFRHFIFLSSRHAVSKYGNRLFSKEGISRGWHHNRASIKADEICFPLPGEMKRWTPDCDFDISDPHKEHIFLNQESTHSKYTSRFLFTLPKKQDSGSAGQESTAYAVPFLVGFPNFGFDVLKSILEPHYNFTSIPFASIMESLLENDKTGFQELVDKHGLAEVFHLGPTWEVPGNVHNLQDGFSRLADQYTHNHGGRLFADATPGHICWMAGIQSLLPSARFLHVICDIRALLSRMKEAGPLDTGEIEKATTSWLISVTGGRMQAQFCKQYMEIKLEDFCREPGKYLTAMGEFLGIRTIDFNGNLPVDAAKLNPCFGNAIVNMLSEKELQQVDSIAGMTLHDLGYHASKLLMPIRPNHRVL